MPHARQIKPTMRIQRTNAQVYDQGITYNEPGLTYNEIGYAYGGLYEYAIVPLMTVVLSPKPHIVTHSDIYTPFVEPGESAGMPMGLLLALTYST